MKQTRTRQFSPERALAAQMNEVVATYDRTVLYRAEATLDQIRKVTGRL